MIYGYTMAEPKIASLSHSLCVIVMALLLALWFSMVQWPTASATASAGVAPSDFVDFVEAEVCSAGRPGGSLPRPPPHLGATWGSQVFKLSEVRSNCSFDDVYIELYLPV